MPAAGRDPPPPPASTPSFIGQADPFNGLDVGWNSAPAFADLDGDGQLDLVVGEYYGTLRTFLSTSVNDTVAVTVTATDDLGVAHDDRFWVAENGLITTRNVFAANGFGGAADTDADSALAVTSVNGSAGNVGHQIALTSGALLTLNADGTFVCDPNHAFDSLVGAETGALNTRALDTFTYATGGGAEATVTVAVTGISNGDMTLLGNSWNNTITGAGGQDTLWGGSGDDQLSGGAGSDELYGGAGYDTLTGGAGADRLVGGGGCDAFVFSDIADLQNGGGLFDRIIDFEQGYDVIDLSGLGITSYRGTLGFSGAGAEVCEVRYADRTVLNFDIDGDRHTDARIVVRGHIDLHASDFIL